MDEEPRRDDRRAGVVIPVRTCILKDARIQTPPHDTLRGIALRYRYCTLTNMKIEKRAAEGKKKYLPGVKTRWSSSVS